MRGPWENNIWPLDHPGLEKILQMLASGSMPSQWMEQALRAISRDKQAAHALQGRTLN